MNPVRWLIDALWRMAARRVTRDDDCVSNLFSISRAYRHIMSADGTDLYMGRWWVLNAYDDAYKRRYSWFPWSVRLHYIRRADADRHLHNHPWNSRTIILKGWYREERPDGTFLREAGYTGQIRHDQYHRIAEVCPEGVWTLFITGPKRGAWGFKVDGVLVPWREYLKQQGEL
jgi:hypothetical protein